MVSSDPPEGEIRIDLGPPSSSSGRRGKIVISLKSWTNIVATGAALIAGVAAYAKPADKSAAKASYEELKKAVEENAQNDKQNHEDIVALRNFLEGYFKGTGAPTAAWTAGSADAGLYPSAAPHPSAFHPQLPVLHSGPRPQNLPDFDKVMKK